MVTGEVNLTRLKNELQQMTAKLSKTGMIIPCSTESPSPSKRIVFSKILSRVKWIQEDMRLHSHIYNRHKMNSTLHEYWAKHKASPARFMISHDRAFATQTG